MNFHNERARRLLLNTVQIYSPQEVQMAIAKVANELNERFTRDEDEAFPLFLAVMSGAVSFAGQLLPHLAFPLEFDYLHVSRYGYEEHGGDVIWKVIPRQNVTNRCVVILDDILDEGHTLLNIQKRLLEMGAAKVITAVLTEKELNTKKPIQADHVGLRVPNRFVIGCGMDVEGYWRNLPDIRALTMDPLLI